MTGKETVHGFDGERALDSMEAKLDVIHTPQDSGGTAQAITSRSCPRMWGRGANSPHT